MTNIRNFSMNFAGSLLLAVFISWATAGLFLFGRIPAPAYLIVMSTIIGTAMLSAYGSIQRPSKNLLTWLIVGLSVTMSTILGGALLIVLATY